MRKMANFGYLFWNIPESNLLICLFIIIIPSKTSRSVSSIPWITYEIRRKIRRKNKTHAKAKKTGSSKLRSKFETLRREIKADVRKQHNLYVNNLVGDVKANPRDFYRYINSQKKDTQGIPPLKRKNGKGVAQSDLEKAEEFNGQFTDVFSKNEHTQVPLTRKRIKKIHASYTLEGTNLENVESIKYLGVTITSDLRWNTHVSNVCTKANRTLGFLRRNLYSWPQEVKEAAYKGLVRQVLDYGSSVWDPPGVVLQEELESVQKRAARFVTGNYNYETGSMTGVLGQLKWESLKKRRKDNRLILLYKGLKGKASVPTDDLIPKTRRCRNQHSMAFQTPIANSDVYKGSFFPQTIRDRNALPDSLISSAEDAEDCVAKFTSLVRARD